MKAAGNNVLVSMGISSIPVLIAKFIGDIPFVMHTTSHQSLISSTVPDYSSPNKAPDQLNRVPDPLDNKASEQPLN